MSQAKPTLTPNGVLFFACSLSMVTYLDRVCFGIAADSIVTDLNLDSIADLKWPITLFTIAYAVFEIPSGWLGDTFGPRKALMRIVLAWSLFTALTGLVGLRVGGMVLGGVATLAVIRFLFGVGEAGAYPNLARAVANWFPPQERARVKGWIWMAGRLMGGLTPMIWAFLVAGTQWTTGLTNWRGAFLLFGMIGVIWCVFFAMKFTDTPQGNTQRVARSETAAAEQPFFFRMLSDANLWIIGLMYASASFAWYFNINYYPNYLRVRYDLDPQSLVGAIYKGGPLLFGAAGCLLGGYWSDMLLRMRVRHAWARRVPAMTGHVLCAGCYVGAIYAPTALFSFLSISLAAFFNDLMMGPAWATCQDIGGRRTAMVSGWMNMLGNLGGALSGWTVGTILENYQLNRARALSINLNVLSEAERETAQLAGYETALAIFAIVSLVAFVAWFGINAERKVRE